MADTGLKIGCHLSISKGFEAAGKDAIKINASTFQYFTRNPRGGKAKDIDESDINKFIDMAKEHGLSPIIAHAPYTLNPCSANENIREFAWNVMREDLARTEYIPYGFYNFHPGSHSGQGVEAGIELIAGLLNELLYEDMTTTVLLETMAGKGTEIGRNFEELAQIIERIKLKEKIGICLDTCHVYDAGYDIVNNLDGVLDEFDRIIGLDRLKAVHLNDSKNESGSRKDRHEKLGEGTMGMRTFINIINHPKLRHLPFILETPNELEGYAKEIGMLQKAYI